METQLVPPSLEDITKALRPIVAAGLPVRPNFSDETLLALRGVVARSIDPDDRLNRVKALQDLLARLLLHFPNDQLGESARTLFGLTPGTRGKNLTARRQQAADEAGYESEHFRKRVEPQLLQQVAWQLHQDSQNYIPRSRATPPPLENSGDTPTLRWGDVSSKDASEHQEQISRLWAHVYALRANILRVERLKVWPFDPSEPATSEEKLQQAVAARNREVQVVKILIQRYIQTYGQRIEHGDAEFNAAALLRLAGWSQDL
ncbi:hypothetical protein [Paenarthrobacter sp. JL.01a]|uniref:hypothetical protein n=1 Tax=Paenarthrobacter sp. JL.01a TaxID=2979324 RepID=UPI0021CA4F9B|nr:hypothetical protein [Paenarthrobacter sp. JL.01a]UXM91010.1 hypothetical protein N5P29_17180 [Paenarthrobacter sp. JL.01a]